MGKTICKDYKDLKKKVKQADPIYYCKKCGKESPKEKWVCKPKPIIG